MAGICTINLSCTLSSSRTHLLPSPARTVKLPELSWQGISYTDLRIDQVAVNQSRPVMVPSEHDHHKLQTNSNASEFMCDAYERCRHICAEYAKTFYLGSLLMTEERQKAIWAIYVWCRRTDELVDGPNASHMSSSVLDQWEERLEDIFNFRPYDMLDAALSETVKKFPLDIKPFRDMIEGMRMDAHKCRYQNFRELYMYCYYVAGTVGLMSVPVMGIDPNSKTSVHTVYNAAVNLGIGFQLTNILRDVGEDALRGRVYLPQDELKDFGLCDEQVYSMRVNDTWREFMKEQIRRARFYFNEAEEGTSQLEIASRWPVWSSLMLYRKILDAIEANDYNNLTKRAYVGRAKKFLTLPLAYTRAVM